jgi:adenosylcobinamide kinase/adenosylcobinamide-phosphate guanylyltransferase
MNELELVLGGARSGKSSWAERRAAQLAGDRVAYVATGEAGDGEMAERIARHRASRPASWTTIEAPVEVGEAIRRGAGLAEAVLVDCLTLATSNWLCRPPEPESEAAALERCEGRFGDLLAAIDEVDRPVIVVSNEVGLGIIPEHRLARVFRDVLGRFNARLAARARRTIWLVAGVPVDLHRLSQASLGEGESWP